MCLEKKDCIFAYLCFLYKTHEISCILDCFCAIGWRNVSKNEDIRSVGPSKPEMMGPSTGLGLWIFNIDILGGLGVCKSHFSVMSSMCSPWCNRLMRSLTIIALSVIELHLSLIYFLCFFHDNCRCPFVCFCFFFRGL